MAVVPGPQVTDVELDRERELRVTFDDGVVAVFPLDELREACPCAGCIGRRDRGLPATIAAGPVTAAGAELHGSWGIAIRWSDGHDTGIHGWEQLRDRWDRGIDEIASSET